MVQSILSAGPSARPRRVPRIGRWLLLAAAALAAMAASAASLQVNPILVEFKPGERSHVLWLSNSGTAPIQAQVRVSAWTQAGDEDRLEASRDLVASPAIMEVPAGGQQLVRLIRPQLQPLQSEAAYRLTIDELPRDTKVAGAGVQFLLRYSVPVFILAEGTSPLDPARRTAAPQVATAVKVSASLAPGEKNSVLIVSNPGRQRVRLGSLAWVDRQGRRTELVPGLVGYVLAGQRMQWTIPLPAKQYAEGGDLKVRFNDDPNDQTLPLEAPGG